MKDQSLHSAYIATHYTVQQDPPWRLWIDLPNPPLIHCYNKFNCNSCTFISAFNPQSQLRANTVNTVAQQKLITHVTGKGWHWLPGLATAADRSWPTEENLLIMGITLVESFCQAKKFNQKAFYIL